MRIVGILVGAGLVWAGIAFAGFALTTLLEPNLGLAGAAALTAAVLLIGPAFVAIFYSRRRSRRLRDATADTVLSVIASIARERPLLAVLGAALFGAAEVFLFRPRKK